MKKSVFYVIAFTIFFQFGCTKDQDPQPSSHLEEKKILNYSYGAAERQKMDVYLPEKRTESTPFVVILHGGSWIEGNKEDMRFVQEELLRQGVGSINLNYRYAAYNHHYSGMMEDVRAAIKTTRDHANDWGIRNRQYSLLGYSAGAHLALLYAYGFKESQEIKTVISIAGPTELKTLSVDPLQNILLSTILIGVLPGDFYTDAKTDDASPLFHVENAVPTLIIHGTQDEVVPFGQSEKLRGALNLKGIQHKFVSLEGSKHDVTGNPLHVLKIMSESSAWIHSQGK